VFSQTYCTRKALLFHFSFGEGIDLAMTFFKVIAQLSFHEHSSGITGTGTISTLADGVDEDWPRI